MKPPEEIKREFVRQWMQKADADLATARHLSLARIDLGFAIGFHAQQAVEKIAKAVLVWHQVEFFKTHDLTRLAQLLAPIDPRLAEVIRAADDSRSTRSRPAIPATCPSPAQPKHGTHSRSPSPCERSSSAAFPATCADAGRPRCSCVDVCRAAVRMRWIPSRRWRCSSRRSRR